MGCFPDVTKTIVIPENIAIQLANSSEVSGEYFFRNIYRRYQQLQKQKEPVTTGDEVKLKAKSLKALRKYYIPPYKQIVSDSESESVSGGQSQSQNQNQVEQSFSTTITSEKQIIALPYSSTTAAYIDSAYAARTKDQAAAAYVDDEDLDPDYDQSEASGANRIRQNDTSNIFEFKNSNSD